MRSAKASAEKSAALVSDDKQEAQLGKLMTQVEKLTSEQKKSLLIRKQTTPRKEDMPFKA